MPFIYLIENTVTGSAYVGKANDVKKRWARHCGAAKDSGAFLYRAMRKYGLSSFVVHTVDQHEDEEYVLRVLEPEWIAYMREMGVHLYNVSEGGRGVTGFRHTDSAKRKMRDAKLGYVPSAEMREKLRAANLGNSPSQEARMKISAANRGRSKPPRTKEHCAKISAAKKGKKLSPDHAAKIREAMKSSDCVGHPITDEVKERIAAKLRDQKQSAETRAKRSASMAAAWERRRAARSSPPTE